jgi:hypothetical protein
MLFRNNNGELKNIKKIDYINDKDYYKMILQFMNTRANINNSHNTAVDNLINKIKILI